MILGYDWPRLHAALNDLPAALLTVGVLFDLAAWAFKRESLRWAAIWTLWAGVLGGWLAVIAGEQASDVIEHGDAIHELMEKHETLGLITMSLFTALLVWRLWRRFRTTAAEEWVLRVLAVALSRRSRWSSDAFRRPAARYARRSSSMRSGNAIPVSSRNARAYSRWPRPTAARRAPAARKASSCSRNCATCSRQKIQP